jgi:hypothetical protein
MRVRELTFISMRSWRAPDRYRPKHRKADKQANLCDEHVHRHGHGDGRRVRERALRTSRMMGVNIFIFEHSLFHLPVVISEPNNTTFSLGYQSAGYQKAT